MKLSRILGMGLVGAFVVATMSFGGITPAALAATIPPPITDPDIGHLDFETPRNAASYKTTVPSSVLKDAAKMRAASRGTNLVMTNAEVAHAQSQVASAYRQTRGAKLATATNGPSVKDWTAAQRAQSATAATITRQAANVGVPATPMTKMGKLIAGANVVSGITTGAYVGFQLGKGMSSVLGADVTGGLCAPSFEDAGLVAILTGTDCTDFFNLPADYVPNTDVSGGTIASGICAGPTGSASNATRPGAATCGGGHIVSRTDTVWNKDYSYVTIDAVERTSTGIVVTYTVHPFTRSTNSQTMSYPNIVPYCWSPTNNGSSSANGTTNANGSVPTTQTTQGGTYTYASNLSGCSSASSFYAVKMLTNKPGVSSYDAKTEGWAYVQGQPLVPVVVNSPDPERTLDCVIATTDGQQFKATSAKFTEGTGILAEPVCPAVPDGLVAESITVTESPAVPGGAPIPLLDTETTEGYQRLAEDFPECLTGLCTADLRQVQPDTGTGVQTSSCFDDLSSDACLDWYSNPNKADQYVCEYGGTVVALTECNHYAHVFDPAKQAAGQPYADADTGASAPVGSAPSTSPMNDAILDPSKPRNCFPTGWGVMNPLDWVMKPVGCALQTAFVPRPLIVAATLGQAKTAMDDKMPGQLVAAVTGLEFQAPPSGCNGIRVDVWFLGPPFQLMPACPGDFFADLAALSRIFGNVSFTVFGVIAITRHVGRVFGYGGLGTAAE